MIFGIICVCLLGCIVDAAPRPLPKARPQGFEVFESGSVYPHYFLHHPAPPLAFNPYPDPFFRGALNGTSFNDTTLNKLFDPKNFEFDLKSNKLWDPKNFGFNSLKPEDLAKFKASLPKPEDLAAFKTKIISFEGLDGIHIVNPFIAGKTIAGKIAKTDQGLPYIKAGKPNETYAKDFSLVNPFTGGVVDPVFGPEIAPRYEIHYTLGDHYNFDAFPFNFDFAPIGGLFPFGFDSKNGTFPLPTFGGDENGGKKPELADGDSSASTEAAPSEPSSGETSAAADSPNGDATTTQASSERKRRQRLNKRKSPRQTKQSPRH